MSDLIDRQAILKHIEKIRQGVQMMDDMHRASIIMNGMHLCEEAVRNQPSAQPERTGKWLHDDNFYYETRFVCSECKESECVPAIGFAPQKPLWEYCPNCGARMVDDERSD